MANLSFETAHSTQQGEADSWSVGSLADEEGVGIFDATPGPTVWDPWEDFEDHWRMPYLVHYVADTANDVSTADATDLASAITLATDLRAKYTDHVYSVGNLHLSTSQIDISVKPDAVDEPTLVVLVNDLKEKFNQHIDRAPSVHSKRDVQNTVSTADATNTATAITLINAIKAAYNLHIALVGYGSANEDALFSFIEAGSDLRYEYSLAVIADLSTPVPDLRTALPDDVYGIGIQLEVTTVVSAQVYFKVDFIDRNDAEQTCYMFLDPADLAQGTKVYDIGLTTSFSDTRYEFSSQFDGIKNITAITQGSTPTGAVEFTLGGLVSEDFETGWPPYGVYMSTHTLATVADLSTGVAVLGSIIPDGQHATDLRLLVTTIVSAPVSFKVDFLDRTGTAKTCYMFLDSADLALDSEVHDIGLTNSFTDPRYEFTSQFDGITKITAITQDSNPTGAVVFDLEQRRNHVQLLDTFEYLDSEQGPNGGEPFSVGWLLPGNASAMPNNRFEQQYWDGTEWRFDYTVRGPGELEHLFFGITETYESDWRGNDTFFAKYYDGSKWRFKDDTVPPNQQLISGDYSDYEFASIPDLNTGTVTYENALPIGQFSTTIQIEVTSTVSVASSFQINFLDNQGSAQVCYMFLDADDLTTGDIVTDIGLTASSTDPRYRFQEQFGGIRQITSITPSAATGAVKFTGGEKNFEDFEEDWTLTLDIGGP